MIDITGLDKAQVLLALWKGSHCQGVSFLGMHERGLTPEKAKDMIRDKQIRRFNTTIAVSDDETEDALNDKFNVWLANDPFVPMYFDYVEGHVIKCDISGDAFDERLYDRDCGEGRAAEVIQALRDGKEIPNQAYEGSEDPFQMILNAIAKEHTNGEDK